MALIVVDPVELDVIVSETSTLQGFKRYKIEAKNKFYQSIVHFENEDFRPGDSYRLEGTSYLLFPNPRATSGMERILVVEKILDQAGPVFEIGDIVTPRSVKPTGHEGRFFAPEFKGTIANKELVFSVPLYLYASDFIEGTSAKIDNIRLTTKGYSVEAKPFSLTF